MFLVSVLEPTQDVDTLLDTRRIDGDGLETPLQGTVLLDILAVFIQRRGADTLNLAAGQCRFEHIGRIYGSLGRASTHQGVQFIDENDDVFRLHNLLHDRLHARLELSAILRAGYQCPEIQRHHAAVEQQLGHFAIDDTLGQPLHDRSLAYPRLANEHRVILRAPAEDLHHPLDLVLAPYDRIKFAVLAQLGEVTAEFIQGRGLALFFRFRCGFLQEVQDFLTRLDQANAKIVQHLGANAFLFLEQAEKQVLRTNVVVTHKAGLFHTVLQHFLGFRGERYFPDNQGVCVTRQMTLDFHAHMVDAQTRFLQHRYGDTASVFQHAEQDVFRPQIFVVVALRFFSGEDNYPSGPLCKSLEHCHISSGCADLAVDKGYHSVHVGSEILIMRHNDEGLPQFLIQLTQQCLYGLTCGPIEISGRFIGKHDLGTVDQRSGNRNPLLLASRQRTGTVM